MEGINYVSINNKRSNQEITPAIRSIGTYCAGDRENNYYITIANDSFWNEKLNNEDSHYHSERIIISAIDDDEIFPRK